MTTLVLLPGLDGTGSLFQPLLRELPAGWRTRVVAYPMDARADYVVLTRLAAEALPADGPLVVLGESFSGPVAIRLAAALGPRLRALILCCSFARSPRPALSRLGRLLPWLPPPGLVPAWLSERVLLGGGPSDEARVLLAEALAQLPAAVLRARLRMVMAVDVSEELAAVRAPVLYLQAGQDRVVPPAAAVHVRRACPQVVITRIDGPHGLLQAAPGRCVAAMTSFLAPLH
ncbi:alpha/beta fold hydrolase [Roseateles sp. BYS78W]|uniref:Alpha/beta fold hydrolase n=1 Tax=Pelomonas candidula TaxID=3299025 RepID=A0ABW7H8B6_9BURK